MEDKSILIKYDEFLKLNQLTISYTSARDFCDLEENITPLELSMEFLRKGATMTSNSQKKKFYEMSLEIEPNNFSAKTAIAELNGFNPEDYEEIIKEEYERLLADGYMDPRYYPNSIVEFGKYQETFNFIRGLRSYYVALVAKGKYKEALGIATEIIELNPQDTFRCKSSLCFLYLREADIVSALGLVETDTNIIIGAKELVLSICAYLNLEPEKSLEYLMDLEACNPYLFRLLTHEAEISFDHPDEDIYGDSSYVYLNLAICGDLLESYQAIIDEAKRKSPLLLSLEEDERLVLTLCVLEQLDELTPEIVKSKAKEHRKTKELSEYSIGRIEGIIQGLMARGLFSMYKMTILGDIYYNRIEDQFYEEGVYYRKKAESLFLENKIDEGLEQLSYALEIAPSVFLMKEYLFHMKEYDFDYAYDLISKMIQSLESYTAYTEYSTIAMRQKLLSEIYEVCYKTYEEAIAISYEKAIEVYKESKNPFVTFTQLIQMLELEMNFDLPKDEPFVLLYKKYKETKKMDKQLLILCVKESKRDYAFVQKGNLKLPYKLINPSFYLAYIQALHEISLMDILSDKELYVLKSILESKEAQTKIRFDIEYFPIFKTLETEEFITEESDNDYQVEEFVHKYFITKEN